MALLGEVLAGERRVSAAACVRHVHVANAPVRGFGHLFAVRCDPLDAAHVALAGRRHHRHLLGAVHRGRVVHGEDDLPPGRALEVGVDVFVARERVAVDGEQVVAFLDADARRGERAGLVRPRLAGVDLGEAVAAVGDLVIRTEEADGDLIDVGRVAAAGVRVADGHLAAHHVKHVVEVGPVLGRFEPRAIPFVDGVPIRAVEVFDVQEVALVAPRLAEDLCPLGLRVDARLQVERQRTLAHGRAARSRDDAPRAPGAVEELLPVVREREGLHALHEGRRLALVDVVALEHRAGAHGGLLQVEQRALRTGFEARIDPPVDAERHDAVAQSVEVDVDRDLVAVGLLARGFAVLVGFIFDRLFVTAGEEGRCAVFCEHGGVEAVCRRAAVRGHVKPARVEPEVRAAKEVEVVAAGVPHGVAGGHERFRTRDAGRFTAFHRVEPDGVVQVVHLLGIGDPLAIGRPPRVDAAAGRGVLIGVDARGLAGCDVERPDVEVDVGEQHVRAVGRPLQVVVERRPRQVDGAGCVETFLVSDEQLILAGGVREPGDPRAVGRPGGRVIAGAGAFGEVAPVAVLGGHGEDLAARFDDGADAGGREGGEVRVEIVLPVGPRPREVAADVNLQLLRRASLRVVQVKITALLVDDDAAARVDPFHVVLIVGGDLRQVLGCRVVRVHVHREVAVGEEVDGVAEPDGLAVAAAVPGQLCHLHRVEVEHADGLRLPAAVVAPLGVPRVDELVGEALAAIVQIALEGAGHRHPLRHAAGCGVDRPHLRLEARAALPAGDEQHAPVRRPAAHVVATRVVGDAPGLAALHRDDEGIRVAVVLAGEGDLLAVAREVRIGFRAGEAGEPLGVAAGAIHDPEIVRVGEDDVLITHRGLAEELGALGRGCGGDAGEQEEDEPAAETRKHGSGESGGRISGRAAEWLGVEQHRE